jgi:6-pyruvoyltetrahydropterin/6-carboxytetrahydropterin synthase
MLRLTREVRFALNDGDSPDQSIAGDNGFGGVPPVRGLAHYLVLQVTLAGDIDPASSYLRNIKEIDVEVRRRAIPRLASLVRERRFTHASAIRSAYEALADAWPGVGLERLCLMTSPYQSVSIDPTEPTMIRLSQKFEFSAAHRLHNPALDERANIATFGKCNNPHGHGHNYEVQVTLAGTPDAAGTLMPIDEFERLVDQHAIDLLDHKFLNVEVDAFKTLNPSVENIAKVIYEMLKSRLKRDHFKLASVTVWETPKTWAEYAE